jgi:hypothetical protein
VVESEKGLSFQFKRLIYFISTDGHQRQERERNLYGFSLL